MSPFSPPAKPSDVHRLRGARIAGTGLAIPSIRLTNDDLAKRVDTNDEWITKRTGIKVRHICDENTFVLDLAERALLQALDRAALKATDLDMVIVATLTPEMCTPSTAARLVSRVKGIPGGAVDVSAACSGFVYGLNMAWALIQTGFYRNIAVLGAETLSRVTDWKDRGSCVLFGDGAGCAIISATDDPEQGSLYHTMGSNGDLWPELYCPRHPGDVPPGANFTGAYNTLQMNGREVFKFAVSTLQDSVDKALAFAGINADDLAVIIPHQSNARILEAARDRLGVGPDKLYINIDRYGNTSAASVPICLHEIMEAGKLKKGDLVLFVALGGGMTWATNLWRL